MADIELVIKVSEDIYKDIIENGFIYDEDNEVVTYAIKNGTPLPKGHGRLIDEDALIGKIHGVKSITAVLDAKTIIEADNESEDKE